MLQTNWVATNLILGNLGQTQLAIPAVGRLG